VQIHQTLLRWYKYAAKIIPRPAFQVTSRCYACASTRILNTVTLVSIYYAVNVKVLMHIYSDGDALLSERCGTSACFTAAGAQVLGNDTQVPWRCCAAILTLIRKAHALQSR
jgi:hypothetical protein